jgi:lactate dehydrogenase-like 2-hydroxyacid dehydrogenase
MTSRHTVLVTRKLPKTVQDRLKRDYDARLNPDDIMYTTDDLIKLSWGADALLTCNTEHFTGDVVLRLPDTLKIVANYSVGVDHCDLESFRKRGIIVTNTPDVLSDATAEIAILLMLGAARRASEGERMMRERSWNKWSPEFMVGSAVTGKRLGIIGMGRVGQIVAKRALGFEMEIHYCNRSRLPEVNENGAIYHDSVESLLPVSDVLSLNCPATPETINLLTAERIAMLPDGAIIVNTARGALIDEKALVDALNSGKLASAGLDVYRTEPGGSPTISKLPNTFLLPHIGSATIETRNAMGFRALDNLDAYFSNRAPRDRVA